MGLEFWIEGKATGVARSQMINNPLFTQRAEADPVKLSGQYTVWTVGSIQQAEYVLQHNKLTNYN